MIYYLSFWVIFVARIDVLLKATILISILTTILFEKAIAANWLAIIIGY